MSYKTSVALCTFNGEDYIEEQIDSILNQTVLPDEIVVSDDGSYDGTLEIVKKKLENPQIKYKILVNRNNLGVVKNFEKAISHCEGDIIFTADQDDVWMEDKIEFITKTFSSNEKLSIVFSDAFLVNKNLSRTGTMLWDAIYPKINKLKTREEILKVLLKQNIMTGATMAFRRSLVNNILPFNELWIHDYWIAITGTLLGEIMALDRQLIMYRQHDSNVIGASKLNFISKLDLYVNNFKKIQEIHLKKYHMMLELKKYIYNKEGMMKFEDKMYFEKAYDFWKQLSNLSSDRKIKSILCIITNYLNKNYYNYYTGLRGAVRDLITVVFFKRNIDMDHNK